MNTVGKGSPELASTIAKLESFVPTPERGLPEEVFQLVSRLTPLVSVDLLIQDDSGQTLLTWRHDVAYGPGWHIPGGVIRYKEHAIERVHAVARRELGVEVACEPTPVAMVEHVKAESRERGHVVSFLYRCRLLKPLDETLRFRADTPEPGHWQWFARGAATLIPEQQVYESYLR